MKEHSLWLSEREASELLSVDIQTLVLLREGGLLKPGSHWRSSTDPEQLPWKPKVFYHLIECKEVIEYCQNTDVSFGQIAA